MINPFPALKRRAIFRKFLRDCSLFAIAPILLITFGAKAETTNGLSDAEIQGRQLAQQLLVERPAEATNTGVLKIRDGNGHRSEIPVRCEVIVRATDWWSIYSAGSTNRATLLVIHTANQSNKYFCATNSAKLVPLLGDVPVPVHLFHSSPLSGSELMASFANSDFWIADLGLEFFHWPAQKVLKKEVKRSRGCAVLESTNPNPSPNGYSRVICWIDSETLGIVQAQAFDAKGRLLKEFYPKDIKKVKGQWQVESMVINNVQTGSRTRLEFDLKVP
jgi:hypothetical protein